MPSRRNYVVHLQQSTFSFEQGRNVQPSLQEPLPQWHVHPDPQTVGELSHLRKVLATVDSLEVFPLDLHDCRWSSKGIHQVQKQFGALHVRQEYL